MQIEDLMDGNNFYLRQLYGFLGPPLETTSNQRGLEILQHYGVLPTKEDQVNRRCPQLVDDRWCGMEISTVIRDSGLGFNFHCAHDHVWEPFVNTLLSDVRCEEFDYDELLLVMYRWCFDHSVSKDGLSSIMEELQIDSETLLAWYKRFREIAQIVAWHDFVELGGEHDVVEVDQKYIFRKKIEARHSTMCNAVWIVGGFSRTNKCVFGKVLSDRTSDTLQVMQQYIHHESHICSSEGREYIECEEVFGGHSTTSNTQHIARSWRTLKGTMRRCTQLEYIDSYIGEWMYRTNIIGQLKTSGEKFTRFLQDIVRVYPGLGKEPIIADLENCICHECK